MSLLRSSDESLEHILHYLTGADVLRLMATGSRLLTTRILQIAKDLQFFFGHSTLFPFSAYSFPRLRSLTINATSGQYSNYLSTKGRSVLPLEPVDSLLSLKLDFAASSAVLKSSQLNEAFPNLRSLVILSSSLKRHLLPLNWAQSLPRKLSTLKIELTNTAPHGDERFPVSSFDSLPEGLEHLSLKISLVPPGALNLKRLKNLKTVQLSTLRSYDVLYDLPDSLEEVRLRFAHWCLTSPDTMGSFPTSKLPPKIRVWDVYEPQLAFNFDNLVPPTLEQSLTNWNTRDVNAETLTTFFPRLDRIQSLSVAYSTVGRLPLQLLEHLPNLVTCISVPLPKDDDDAYRFLPRNLKTLDGRKNGIGTRSYATKHLPPSLEYFIGTVSREEHVVELPKTLTKLKLLSLPLPPSLPISVWLNMPPQLTSLSADAALFQSLDCLQALPTSLKRLKLRSLKNRAVKNFSVPEALQASLEELSMSFSTTQYGDGIFPISTEWIKGLGACKRLSSLVIETLSDYTLPLRRSTLSNLPNSLTKLSLRGLFFENGDIELLFGAASDEEAEEENREEREEQGEELSRLPESLRSLSLHFLLQDWYYIDFDVFSMLPEHLNVLEIEAPSSYCKNPSKLISSLPKHLTVVKIQLPMVEPEYMSTNEDDCFQPDRFEMEIGRALNDYYATPFWKPNKDMFYPSKL